MTIGPISAACRTFLSRHRLSRSWVSRQLLDKMAPQHHGTVGRLHLQGKGWNYPVEGGDSFNDALIEHDPRSGKVLLKVKRTLFWYREHGIGTADLIVFNRELPEVLCLGMQPGLYRLSQLIEHASDPFYRESDPVVVSMRNAQRLGRPAIVLRVLPEWSERNWDYGAGLDP